MNLKILMVLSGLILAGGLEYLVVPKATIALVTPGIVDKTVLTPPTVKEVTNKHIKRFSLKAPQIVFIVGPIGANAKAYVDEIHAKAKLEKDLYLLIDSPGGSVMDGGLVVSAMEASQARVHTVCIGLCASMAFIIHQHGATRLAVDRTVLMGHPASGGAQGTLAEMQSQLNMITRYVDKEDAYIAKRAGLTFAEFKAQVVQQKWIDAEDAKDSHFVDDLVDIETDSKPIILPFPFQETRRFSIINE